MSKNIEKELRSVLEQNYLEDFGTYDYDGIAKGVLGIMSVSEERGANVIVNQDGHRNDFNGWNEEKKRIHHADKVPNFKVCQVWWCALGVNVGNEQNGKNENFERPILIIRKFNRDLFLGVPLTTKIREGDFFYNLPEWNSQKGQAILAQARVLSSKRLLRLMYKMAETQVDAINDKLFELIKKRNPDTKSGNLGGLTPDYSSSIANSGQKVNNRGAK